MAHPVYDIFARLRSNALVKEGRAVTDPATGETIAHLKDDDAASINGKIEAARVAQERFAQLPRDKRQALVEQLSEAIRTHREDLAGCVHYEGGKTMKEGMVEADGSADVLLKTIKDATLADMGNMRRCKERPPVGVVGLITSFNFPLVVAHWTIAPALLAANAIVWKPSEKTPLAALATKAIFDRAVGEYKDLLQVIIGGRDVGQALVAHEQVAMVSATGSVGMGKAIMQTLSQKQGNIAPPILELGGNNGVVISEHVTKEHLGWAIGALMNSFLGTTGQRCTNTRRLFVHSSHYEDAVGLLKEHIVKFVQESASGIADDNAYGYRALIDEDAFKRFEYAKARAKEEGGLIIMGERLFADVRPGAYVVSPALALMPKQTPIMHEETFAPLLYVAPYAGDIDQAIAEVNAPDNAGLVAGIYTQSRREAERFAQFCEAGHCLINAPKGTGTPAHGMGFGGNKDSGTGEILNAADPLAAFTQSVAYRRIAQNNDIVMQD